LSGCTLDSAPFLVQAGHAQGQDVFSRQIAVPPLPTKARFTAGGAAAEAPSGVPPADDAALAGLEYSDRQRLMKERSEATGIDRGYAKVGVGTAALEVCSWGVK
jgi:hypothetical protein